MFQLEVVNIQKIREYGIFLSFLVFLSAQICDSTSAEKQFGEFDTKHGSSNSKVPLYDGFMNERWARLYRYPKFEDIKKNIWK